MSLNQPEKKIDENKNFFFVNKQIMEQQLLCQNGCGFYGNPATEGYCSLCHKSKHISTMTTEQIHSELQTLSTRKEELKEMMEQEEEEIKCYNQLLTRKRCAQCNKKLGVCEGIECRCQQLFCSLHRYPAEHHCQFNFVHLDASIISRSVGHGHFEKLDKI